MSAASDRQFRPIYDALETGSNKSAILACTKLLKKQPNNLLAKALKALALVRLQKVEDSLVLCDEVLASKPTDDSTLTAMMHVLRGLGRNNDIIAMFDNAYKQQPNSEDLGTQTFQANVRVGNWKAAQQIATRMHKHFQDDRFLYWSAFCAFLQASDTATPENLRAVLLQLALRWITSNPNSSLLSADRFYMHVLVLRELEMFDEAYSLMSSATGQVVCQTSLVVDELRRDILRHKGMVKEEGVRATGRILDRGDRNWLEFLAVLEAAFWDVTSIPEPTEAAKASCKEQIEKARDVFVRVAEADGPKDRSGPLALLELEQRSIKLGLSSDPSQLRVLAEKYFSDVGDKACCYEDLQPYIQFEGEELVKWTAFLEAQKSFDSVATLPRGINALKLLRYNLSQSEVTLELESARAAEYAQRYLEGLPFGKELPDTELQPADDLVILAGQAYVSLWKLTGSEAHLYAAISILEYASIKSKQSYRIRLLLLRLYHLLGAPSLALEQYRLMNIKQIQSDTLSHLVLSRASTFSLSAIGDITYMNECMESSQIYSTNSQDTAEYIARAFAFEKYSQIVDFITFEDRLDNSLQRDLMKIEHVRMRLAHEQITSELVDLELIEIKFIFDRLHHDNRDFDIIPNYQPKSQPSFNEQTIPFGKVPSFGWLMVFLKIYIKVFQHGSDLVDAVEDKILVGDRPKPTNDTESKIPLDERLAKRKQEEIDELTPVESALYDYVTALSEWLGPYHDYTRPPPAALLAEAEKQKEFRPGHPLKSLALAANGAANGQTKKDEDPPTVKEAPKSISEFFDDMRARSQAILTGSKQPLDLVHVITVTQEAFLIFVVETARFKPASVIKINKLGGLVQSFKDIRAKAIEVLNEMSAQLSKLAEEASTREAREAFVLASKPIQASLGFDHDFVLGVAKKVGESRKTYYEGVGKGVTKVLKNHA